MNYEAALLVVTDLERSKRFYHDVLEQDVVLDFGANVTLTGGFSLQTRETWLSFLHREEDALTFGGNVSELYFEEEDFDAFLQRLASFPELSYVHPVQEHGWGQRAVRFYDPDGHIIEVGERLTAVVRRFLNSGLTVAETAARMDVSEDYVRELMA